MLPGGACIASSVVEDTMSALSTLGGEFRVSLGGSLMFRKAVMGELVEDISLT
jgi:hypothetical protein